MNNSQFLCVPLTIIYLLHNIHNSNSWIIRFCWGGPFSFKLDKFDCTTSSNNNTSSSSSSCNSNSNVNNFSCDSSSSSSNAGGSISSGGNSVSSS